MQGRKGRRAALLLAALLEQVQHGAFGWLKSYPGIQEIQELPGFSEEQAENQKNPMPFPIALNKGDLGPSSGACHGGGASKSPFLVPEREEDEGASSKQIQQVWIFNLD